jgi:hypothetical protein
MRQNANEELKWKTIIIMLIAAADVRNILIFIHLIFSLLFKSILKKIEKLYFEL